MKDGFGLPYPGAWTDQPWPVAYGISLFQRLHALEQQEATPSQPDAGGPVRLAKSSSRRGGGALVLGAGGDVRGIHG